VDGVLCFKGLATADDDAALRRLDDDARATRPSRSPALAGTGPAVPS
jgi:hypothetical protein